MNLHQKIVGLILSLGLLILIIELVRRRKLREEYSFLWVLTGLVIFLLVIWEKLMFIISRIIGAMAPTSTIFFSGIFFIVLISLHFSVKISRLTNQVKDLAQKLTILEESLRQKET